MGLFGPPNVEALKAKGNIPGLIKAAGYRKDDLVRRAALAAIAGVRDDTRGPELIPALQGRDSEVAQAAAIAFAQMGAPAIGPLLKGLESPNNAVSERAIATTVQIGRPALDVLLGLLGPRLSDPATYDSLNFYLCSLRIFSQFDDPRVVEVLTTMLRVLPSLVSANIVRALGRIHDRRALTAVVAALNDPHDEVRWAAEGSFGLNPVNRGGYLTYSQYDQKLHQAVLEANNALDEIGVLFDIEGLGGGYYRQSAFRFLFENLDPHRLAGCAVSDGDTAQTLAGGARTYCIAFQTVHPDQVVYLREILGGVESKVLLANEDRFLDSPACTGQPLVSTGSIDANGCFLADKESGFSPEWTKGTPWTIEAIEYSKFKLVQSSVQWGGSGWPTYSQDIMYGALGVRVVNPNEFIVRVGIRSDAGSLLPGAAPAERLFAQVQGAVGRDCIIPAGGGKRIDLPPRSYRIYFQYSTDPASVYRGDDFTLSHNSIEITLAKTSGGNYGIRKVG